MKRTRRIKRKVSLKKRSMTVAHGVSAEPHPDNVNLRLGPRGEKLVKHFEGCHKAIGHGMYAAYLDPIGVPTIGYGHTNHHGRKFKIGDRWTKVECDLEFIADIERFENTVKRLVRIPLKQEQFDALVSFAFNLGEGNLSKSTLLKKLNAGDIAGATDEFPKWNKAGNKVLAGLTRRRKAERLLFLNKDEEE